MDRTSELERKEPLPDGDIKTLESRSGSAVSHNRRLFDEGGQAVDKLKLELTLKAIREGKELESSLEGIDFGLRQKLKREIGIGSFFELKSLVESIDTRLKRGESLQEILRFNSKISLRLIYFVAKFSNDAGIDFEEIDIQIRKPIQIKAQPWSVLERRVNLIRQLAEAKDAKLEDIRRSSGASYRLIELALREGPRLTIDQIDSAIHDANPRQFGSNNPLRMRFFPETDAVEQPVSGVSPAEFEKQAKLIKQYLDDREVKRNQDIKQLIDEKKFDERIVNILLQPVTRSPQEILVILIEMMTDQELKQLTIGNQTFQQFIEQFRAIDESIKKKIKPNPQIAKEAKVDIQLVKLIEKYPDSPRKVLSTLIQSMSDKQLQKSTVFGSSYSEFHDVVELTRHKLRELNLTSPVTQDEISRETKTEKEVVDFVLKNPELSVEQLVKKDADLRQSLQAKNERLEKIRGKVEGIRRLSAENKLDDFKRENKDDPRLIELALKTPQLGIEDIDRELSSIPSEFCKQVQEIKNLIKADEERDEKLIADISSEIKTDQRIVAILLKSRWCSPKQVLSSMIKSLMTDEELTKSIVKRQPYPGCIIDLIAQVKTLNSTHSKHRISQTLNIDMPVVEFILGQSGYSPKEIILAMIDAMSEAQASTEFRFIDLDYNKFADQVERVKQKIKDLNLNVGINAKAIADKTKADIGLIGLVLDNPGMSERQLFSMRAGGLEDEIIRGLSVPDKDFTGLSFAEIKRQAADIRVRFGKKESLTKIIQETKAHIRVVELALDNRNLSDQQLCEEISLRFEDGHFNGENYQSVRTSIRQLWNDEVRKLDFKKPPTELSPTISSRLPKKDRAPARFSLTPVVPQSHAQVWQQQSFQKARSEEKVLGVARGLFDPIRMVTQLSSMYEGGRTPSKEKLFNYFLPLYEDDSVCNQAEIKIILLAHSSQTRDIREKIINGLLKDKDRKGHRLAIKRLMDFSSVNFTDILEASLNDPNPQNKKEIRDFILNHYDYFVDNYKDLALTAWGFKKLIVVFDLFKQKREDLLKQSAPPSLELNPGNNPLEILGGNYPAALKFQAKILGKIFNRGVNGSGLLSGSISESDKQQIIIWLLNEKINLSVIEFLCLDKETEILFHTEFFNLLKTNPLKFSDSDSRSQDTFWTMAKIFGGRHYKTFDKSEEPKLAKIRQENIFSTLRSLVFPSNRSDIDSKPELSLQHKIFALYYLMFDQEFATKRISQHLGEILKSEGNRWILIKAIREVPVFEPKHYVLQNKLLNRIWVILGVSHDTYFLNFIAENFARDHVDEESKVIEGEEFTRDFLHAALRAFTIDILTDGFADDKENRRAEVHQAYGLISKLLNADQRLSQLIKKYREYDALLPKEWDELKAYDRFTNTILLDLSKISHINLQRYLDSLTPLTRLKCEYLWPSILRMTKASEPVMRDNISKEVASAESPLKTQWELDSFSNFTHWLISPELSDSKSVESKIESVPELPHSLPTPFVRISGSVLDQTLELMEVIVDNDQEHKPQHAGKLITEKRPVLKGELRKDLVLLLVILLETLASPPKGASVADELFSKYVEWWYFLEIISKGDLLKDFLEPRAQLTKLPKKEKTEVKTEERKAEWKGSGLPPTSVKADDDRPLVSSSNGLLGLLAKSYQSFASKGEESSDHALMSRQMALFVFALNALFSNSVSQIEKAAIARWLLQELEASSMPIDYFRLAAKSLDQDGLEAFMKAGDSNVLVKAVMEQLAAKLLTKNREVNLEILVASPDIFKNAYLSAPNSSSLSDLLENLLDHYHLLDNWLKDHYWQDQPENELVKRIVTLRDSILEIFIEVSQFIALDSQKISNSSKELLSSTNIYSKTGHFFAENLEQTAGLQKHILELIKKSLGLYKNKRFAMAFVKGVVELGDDIPFHSQIFKQTLYVLVTHLRSMDHSTLPSGYAELLIPLTKRYLSLIYKNSGEKILIELQRRIWPYYPSGGQQVPAKSLQDLERRKSQWSPELDCYQFTCRLLNLRPGASVKKKAFSVEKDYFGGEKEIREIIISSHLLTAIGEFLADKHPKTIEIIELDDEKDEQGSSVEAKSEVKSEVKDEKPLEPKPIQQSEYESLFETPLLIGSFKKLQQSILEFLAISGNEFPALMDHHYFLMIDDEVKHYGEPEYSFACLQVVNVFKKYPLLARDKDKLCKELVAVFEKNHSLFSYPQYRIFSQKCFNYIDLLIPEKSTPDPFQAFRDALANSSEGEDKQVAAVPARLRPLAAGHSLGLLDEFGPSIRIPGEESKRIGNVFAEVNELLVFEEKMPKQLRALSQKDKERKLYSAEVQSVLHQPVQSIDILTHHMIETFFDEKAARDYQPFVASMQNIEDLTQYLQEFFVRYNYKAEQLIMAQPVSELLSDEKTAAKRTIEGLAVHQREFVGRDRWYEQSSLLLNVALVCESFHAFDHIFKLAVFKLEKEIKQGFNEFKKYISSDRLKRNLKWKDIYLNILFLAKVQVRKEIRKLELMEPKSELENGRIVESWKQLNKYREILENPLRGFELEKNCIQLEIVMEVIQAAIKDKENYSTLLNFLKEGFIIIVPSLFVDDQVVDRDLVANIKLSLEAKGKYSSSSVVAEEDLKEEQKEPHKTDDLYNFWKMLVEEVPALKGASSLIDKIKYPVIANSFCGPYYEYYTGETLWLLHSLVITNFGDFLRYHAFYEINRVISQSIDGGLQASFLSKILERWQSFFMQFQDKPQQSDIILEGIVTKLSRPDLMSPKPAAFLDKLIGQYLYNFDFNKEQYAFQRLAGEPIEHAILKSIVRLLFSQGDPQAFANVLEELNEVKQIQQVRELIGYLIQKWFEVTLWKEKLEALVLDIESDWIGPSEEKPVVDLLQRCCVSRNLWLELGRHTTWRFLELQSHPQKMLVAALYHFLGVHPLDKIQCKGLFDSSSDEEILQRFVIDKVAEISLGPIPDSKERLEVQLENVFIRCLNLSIDDKPLCQEFLAAKEKALSDISEQKAAPEEISVKIENFKLRFNFIMGACIIKNPTIDPAFKTQVAQFLLPGFESVLRRSADPLEQLMMVEMASHLIQLIEKQGDRYSGLRSYLTKHHLDKPGSCQFLYILASLKSKSSQELKSDIHSCQGSILINIRDSVGYQENKQDRNVELEQGFISLLRDLEKMYQFARYFRVNIVKLIDFSQQLVGAIEEYFEEQAINEFGAKLLIGKLESIENILWGRPIEYPSVQPKDSKQIDQDIFNHFKDSLNKQVSLSPWCITVRFFTIYTPIPDDKSEVLPVEIFLSWLRSSTAEDLLKSKYLQFKAVIEYIEKCTEKSDNAELAEWLKKARKNLVKASPPGEDKQLFIANLAREFIPSVCSTDRSVEILRDLAEIGSPLILDSHPVVKAEEDQKQEQKEELKEGPGAAAEPGFSIEELIDLEIKQQDFHLIFASKLMSWYVDSFDSLEAKQLERIRSQLTSCPRESEEFPNRYLNLIKLVFNQMGLVDAGTFWKQFNYLLDQIVQLNESDEKPANEFHRVAILLAKPDFDFPLPTERTLRQQLLVEILLVSQRQLLHLQNTEEAKREYGRLFENMMVIAGIPKDKANNPALWNEQLGLTTVVELGPYLSAVADNYNLFHLLGLQYSYAAEHDLEDKLEVLEFDLEKIKPIQADRRIVEFLELKGDRTRIFRFDDLVKLPSWFGEEYSQQALLKNLLIKIFIDSHQLQIPLSRRSYDVIKEKLLLLPGDARIEHRIICMLFQLFKQAGRSQDLGERFFDYLILIMALKFQTALHKEAEQKDEERFNNIGVGYQQETAYLFNFWKAGQDSDEVLTFMDYLKKLIYEAGNRIPLEVNHSVLFGFYRLMQVKFKVEYDLCLKLPETGPKAGQLYLREIDKKIALTIINPRGRVVLDFLTDIPAPTPFTLGTLAPLKENLLEILLEKGYILKADRLTRAPVLLIDSMAGFLHGDNVTLNLEGCFGEFKELKALTQSKLEDKTGDENLIAWQNNFSNLQREIGKVNDIGFTDLMNLIVMFADPDPFLLTIFEQRIRKNPDYILRDLFTQCIEQLATLGISRPRITAALTATEIKNTQDLFVERDLYLFKELPADLKPYLNKVIFLRPPSYVVYHIVPATPQNPEGYIKFEAVKHPIAFKEMELISKDFPQADGLLGRNAAFTKRLWTVISIGTLEDLNSCDFKALSEAKLGKARYRFGAIYRRLREPFKNIQMIKSLGLGNEKVENPHFEKLIEKLEEEFTAELKSVRADFLKYSLVKKDNLWVSLLEFLQNKEILMIIIRLEDGRLFLRVNPEKYQEMLLDFQGDRRFTYSLFTGDKESLLPEQGESYSSIPDFLGSPQARIGLLKLLAEKIGELPREIIFPRGQFLSPQELLKNVIEYFQSQVYEEDIILSLLFDKLNEEISAVDFENADSKEVEKIVMNYLFTPLKGTKISMGTVEGEYKFLSFSTSSLNDEISNILDSKEPPKIKHKQILDLSEKFVENILKSRYGIREDKLLDPLLDKFNDELNELDFATVHSEAIVELLMGCVFTKDYIKTLISRKSDERDLTLIEVDFCKIAIKNFIAWAKQVRKDEICLSSMLRINTFIGATFEDILELSREIPEESKDNIPRGDAWVKETIVEHFRKGDKTINLVAMIGWHLKNNSISPKHFFEAVYQRSHHKESVIASVLFQLGINSTERFIPSDEDFIENYARQLIGYLKQSEEIDDAELVSNLVYLLEKRPFKETLPDYDLQQQSNYFSCDDQIDTSKDSLAKSLKLIFPDLFGHDAKADAESKADNLNRIYQSMPSAIAKRLIEYFDELVEEDKSLDLQQLETLSADDRCWKISIKKLCRFMKFFQFCTAEDFYKGNTVVEDWGRIHGEFEKMLGVNLFKHCVQDEKDQIASIGGLINSPQHKGFNQYKAFYNILFIEAVGAFEWFCKFHIGMFSQNDPLFYKDGQLIISWPCSDKAIGAIRVCIPGNKSLKGRVTTMLEQEPNGVEGIRVLNVIAEYYYGEAPKKIKRLEAFLLNHSQPWKIAVSEGFQLQKVGGRRSDFFKSTIGGYQIIELKNLRTQVNNWRRKYSGFTEDWVRSGACLSQGTLKPTNKDLSDLITLMFAPDSDPTIQRMMVAAPKIEGVKKPLEIEEILEGEVIAKAKGGPKLKPAGELEAKPNREPKPNPEEKEVANSELELRPEAKGEPDALQEEPKPAHEEGAETPESKSEEEEANGSDDEAGFNKYRLRSGDDAERDAADQGKPKKDSRVKKQVLDGFLAGELTQFNLGPVHNIDIGSAASQLPSLGS